MDLSIVLAVLVSVSRRKPHMTVRAPVGLGSPFPGESERVGAPHSVIAVIATIRGVHGHQVWKSALPSTNFCIVVYWWMLVSQ